MANFAQYGSQREKAGPPLGARFTNSSGYPNEKALMEVSERIESNRIGENRTCDYKIPLCARIPPIPTSENKKAMNHCFRKKAYVCMINNSGIGSDSFFAISQSVSFLPTGGLTARSIAEPPSPPCIPTTVRLACRLSQRPN